MRLTFDTIFLPIPLLFALACERLVEQGNGSLQAEPRSLSGFTQVDNESSLSVSVTQGPFAVTVTADANLLPVIVTDIVDNTLVIATTESIWSSLNPRVDVVLPVVTGITIRGSGALTAGPLDAGSLAVTNDGSGVLALEASAGATTVKSGGSGRSTLSGSCSTLDIDLTGSGSVVASDFQSGLTNVTLAGSGGVSVAVSGDVDFDVQNSGSIHAVLNGGNAIFDISGSGSIDWTGETTIVSQRLHGSGSVTEH